MGKYDSSLTRLKPLLDKLQKEQDCLNALLSTINEKIRIDERIDCICYGENEKTIPPSKKLLVYLINNSELLNKKALGIDDGSSNYLKRQMLFDGDSATKQEALRLLEQATIPKSAWYIFEGYTHPDVFIETKNFVIIGEAKRTEKKLTKSTKWLKNRDQLIRHIDSIIDYGKTIVSFLILDRAVSKNYHYKIGLANYYKIEYFRKNLPHRSNEEIQKALKSYIGHTYWDIFEEKYELSFPNETY